jgi:oligopeptidase A
MSSTTNPLLDASGLPRFDEIRVEHVEPGMRTLLDELATDLQALEASARPTWEALLEPLERLQDRLAFTWGIVGHLMAVKNSAALRAVYEKVQPDVVDFSLRVAQSHAIYRHAKAMREGRDWTSLDPGQQRIVDALVRDADLAGVGLEGEARERFNAIQLELADLSTQFSNRVLDATKAFGMVLHDRHEVDGLPTSLLDLAAQSARESGEPSATAGDGPWRITLDAPSLLPFLEHSRRRDLREAVYRAHVTRASAGDLDNTPLIDRTLALRREQAALLGYASYAHMSLASKMAPGVDAVEDLLERLRLAAFDAAKADVEDLRRFAREAGSPEADDLRHWDVAYWAERLRQHRFAYSEEELRPYFPLPHVLAGLFALANRLFGVTITPADGSAPIWHPDVRFFRVHDEGGATMAAFYLDPYSRPAEKRGGAWMDDCIGRSRLLGSTAAPVRLPVAHLVCNSTPPVDGRPSLMTFGEVETLFHEFGHGLQHMLTRVDYGLAAGISNIEWDAVELASQFMENWLYDRDTLLGLTAHVDTGERLPDELFQKISAARTYRAGSTTLRQVYFALVDLALHDPASADGRETPFEVQRRIAEQTTVLPLLPEDRFLCSFTHIFAGGYAAGYYSYKWAEVLSADAFAAFEEAGLGDERAVAATGRRYRDTVLALGGSRAPMDVFKAFRGREPNPEALLRHAGLLGQRTARAAP